MIKRITTKPIICEDIMTYWIIYETYELYPLLANSKGELLCEETKECYSVKEEDAYAIVVEPRPNRLIYLKFRGYGYYTKWLNILARKDWKLREIAERTLTAVERDMTKAPHFEAPKIIVYFIIRAGDWGSIEEPEDYNDEMVYLPPSCLGSVTYDFLDAYNRDPRIQRVTAEEWNQMLEAYRESLKTQPQR